ncbi:hypothetical protein TTHERM_000128779 (macronuclear) [Tetrahymena thermophila SB210]|uniref:Uncharacterized protein n=1 Tax=Tetrahymena thermophila (strain SB210) TaxID=312017 RepID=W7XJT7_TETTS|nr:hypothetical protein TTHERM_000128779 [Tetrahymena thermophila SB210]EWS74319.1 hypothetical protein TTHERM_000128779 [Tetrahymena thermophila SB210]|eukprot:XP_012653140.1 hypothetical protein TTHERM_000128779 [Tetrahymena thermophila SB210]
MDIVQKIKKQLHKTRFWVNKFNVIAIFSHENQQQLQQQAKIANRQGNKKKLIKLQKIKPKITVIICYQRYQDVPQVMVVYEQRDLVSILLLSLKQSVQEIFNINFLYFLLVLVSENKSVFNIDVTIMFD